MPLSDPPEVGLSGVSASQRAVAVSINAAIATGAAEQAGSVVTPSPRDDLSRLVTSWNAFASGDKPVTVADRFRWLAGVADGDLVLAKFFESHLDAIEIMRETGFTSSAAGIDVAKRCAISSIPTGSDDACLWGVWAAQGPAKPPLTAMLKSPVAHDSSAGDGPIILSGRKSWCSGVSFLDGALVTAVDADGTQRLYAVNLHHSGIRVTNDGWNAVGMAGTASVDVVFDAVEAVEVGTAGAYLSRPGFWHGAAGIAACWHGAATGLARPLLERAKSRLGDPATHDKLLAMHLGAVDCALHASRLALADAVRHIDVHRAGGPPFAQRDALRLRGIVEKAATTVIEHVGRGLGAGPLCRDAVHARLAADLPVFLRQSHAEWDLAVQATLTAAAHDPSHNGIPGATPWML